MDRRDRHLLSAYFILAANSWMQHPVGYHYNPITHRDELTSFLAVMTNPEQLVTFPHTIAACFLVAGGLVTGVAVWHCCAARRRGAGTPRVPHRGQGRARSPRWSRRSAR